MPAADAPGRAVRWTFGAMAVVLATLAGAAAQPAAEPRAVADAFALLPVASGAFGDHRLRERIRLVSDLKPFDGVETVGFRLDGPYGEVDAGALLFQSASEADRFRTAFPRVHQEAHRAARWRLATPVRLDDGPEATCVVAAGSPELICVLAATGAAALTVVMVPPLLEQLSIPREAAVRRRAVEVLRAVVPGVRAHLARARAAIAAAGSGRASPRPDAPAADAASRAAIESAIRLFRDAPQPRTPARPAALYRRDYPAARDGLPGRKIGWMKDAAEPATVAAIASGQPMVLAIVDGGGASHRMVADILPCPAINALAGQAIFAISDLADDAHARWMVADARLAASDLPAVVVHVPAGGKLDRKWLLDFPTAGPLAAALAGILRIPLPAPLAPAAGRYGALQPRACGS